MAIEFDQIIDQLTPDIQVETDWTSGSAGLPNDKKVLLLMGQCLATGSIGVPTGVVVKTPQRITSTAKAIALFGKGSNLAVMCEYALKAAPRATIYAVPYKAGTTPVAATGTVTLATNASSSGELRCWVMGEKFVVGIASGDTPTIVAAALVATINAHPNLPLTAGAVAGVITLTARIGGLEQNSIPYRTKITCTGMTSVDTGAFLAGGTVAGDPTTQLAAMVADRYHLIALECQDGTAIGAGKTHIETACTPAEKRWGYLIAACTGDASAQQTLGNTLDSYRVQIACLEKSERPVYVVAAVFAARRALYDCKPSLDDETLPGLLAPYDESVWPGVGEVETALEEGLTPLRPVRATGGVQVVRSVHTRQTTPLSYRDHTIAEKSDYTDLSVINGMAVYKGKTLKSASPPGQPSTITPDRAKAKLGRILKALDKEDVLQGVEAAVAAGEVQAAVNTTTPTRLDCAFPFYPTQTAHQIMMRKTYVTTSSL
jgi:phage tail sheath gpL-like